MSLIEFIKQVEEKRQNVRLAEHFILFFAKSLMNSLKTGARMLDFIYHMTLKLFLNF